MLWLRRHFVSPRQGLSAILTHKLSLVRRLRRGSIQQGQPWDNTKPGTCCPTPDEMTGWRTIPARGNACDIACPKCMHKHYLVAATAAALLLFLVSHAVVFC